MAKIRTSQEVKDCCRQVIKEADSIPGTTIALCFDCQCRWRKIVDCWSFFGMIEPQLQEEELVRHGAT